MSISVYKTFSAGEVLTAADLNASLTQITSNGTDVAFPLTKNSSLGGFSLFFDAANTRSMTDSTKGVNLVLTAFNDAKTTVASAATPDIWTGTGRLVDYTGTVTATGFAAASQAGSRRTLLCAGAAPFTAGANMLIDGYASGWTFTAAAGDTVDVIAVTTTQFRLKVQPATPVVPLHTCEGRLTLTTALAVTTADVTGNNLYYTPYVGNKIALYDGTNWNLRTFTELSIDNGSLTAGKVWDVFIYDNSGTPAIELLVWTSDTARATALTTQNGVLVKTGAVTRRYVGTVRSTGGSQYADTYANRWVWNNYNRVLRPMRVLEATDSWTYTTATFRQANGAATNQLDFVVGVSEDAVTAKVHCFGGNTAAGNSMIVAIGLDVTNAASTGCLMQSSTQQVANLITSLDAELTTIPAVGRHFLAWLEYSTAAGTSTWQGDGGAPTVAQSGIHGWIRA